MEIKGELVLAIIALFTALGGAAIGYVAQRDVSEVQTKQLIQDKSEGEFERKFREDLAILTGELQRVRDVELTELEDKLIAARDMSFEEFKFDLKVQQKPFLEEQMGHYFAATSATSQIANLDNGVVRDEAKRRFWELYWGPLAVVEEPGVEKAMVDFGDALEQGKNCAELQKLSLALAHAARTSMIKSWDKQLGTLNLSRDATEGRPVKGAESGGCKR